jgi:hypothetical protein
VVRHMIWRQGRFKCDTSTSTLTPHTRAFNTTTTLMAAAVGKATTQAVKAATPLAASFSVGQTIRGKASSYTLREQLNKNIWKARYISQCNCLPRSCANANSAAPKNTMM